MIELTGKTETGSIALAIAQLPEIKTTSVISSDISPLKYDTLEETVSIATIPSITSIKSGILTPIETEPVSAYVDSELLDFPVAKLPEISSNENIVREILTVDPSTVYEPVATISNNGNAITNSLTNTIPKTSGAIQTSSPITTTPVQTVTPSQTSSNITTEKTGVVITPVQTVEQTVNSVVNSATKQLDTTIETVSEANFTPYIIGAAILFIALKIFK